MSQRRDGIPVVVHPNGRRTEKLQRVPLTEREIHEGWLQNLLFQHPSLLPVEQIDPDFGPLMPIGQEVESGAGPMDNLYISPGGLLTIVEAKLWRNPEARREVVGQILDYAKEVSQWDYDDLDQKAAELAGKRLWRLVSESGHGDLDEGQFVDAASRNMKAGRFLLLIVGDGIREEMERLGEFLHASPQLRFTLALVELQVFRFENSRRLLIMPVVVGRTIEVVRAVVHVESTAGAQVDVTIVEPEASGGDGGRPGSTSYDEFFADLKESGTGDAGIEFARRLYDDFRDDPRFKINWREASYSLQVRDPLDASRPYTVIVVQRYGDAYVWCLDWHLSRVGLPVELGRAFVRDAGALVGQKVSSKKLDEWEKHAPLDRFLPTYPKFKSLVERFAEEVRSLRSSADA